MDSIKSSITSLENMIKSDIDAIFPEYPFYDDIDSSTSLAILQRYTTPEAMVNASINDITSVIRKASKGLFDSEKAKELQDIAGESIEIPDTEGIDQFPSAVKLQAYGGKAPNMSGSGGKANAVGVTKIRNPHLSNTVYEASVSLVSHRTPEFMDIFNREIAKGKKPTQAYIVVGKRLIYHVYSIMKNKKPYRKRRPMGRGESVSTGTAG